MARTGCGIVRLAYWKHGVATFVMLLMAAGCGATKPADKDREILWPPPPDKARIRFEGIIRNKNDLRRATADLITEALVGKKVPESLEQPMGVAVSPDGKRIYVTDIVKPGVFVIDFEANVLAPFGWAAGIHPSGNSIVAEPDAANLYSFKAPLGIAVDDQEHVYVADSGFARICIFDRNGTLLHTFTHESLEHVAGIAVDSQRRRIYVATSGRKTSPNHGVRVFDLDGNFVAALGKSGINDGEFYFPSYVAVDAEGNLYVADTMNGRVQKLDPDGRYLQGIGKRGDGLGEFDKPKGVALDAFGNLHVVDSTWCSVQIFNQRGQILLFYGGRGRFPGQLANATGVAIDRNNRIYVADSFNRRVNIYQMINTTAEDSMLTPKASAEGSQAP